MQAGHDLARRGNVERRGKEAASDCRQPAQLPACSVASLYRRWRCRQVFFRNPCDGIGGHAAHAADGLI
ncbi:hypothetical protein SV7mr_43660 [Stieleria bergensis]|uniref:Uncharacterized protein n=1 Tax=Stieleria bergensis TaxID=2528025 RepID=A0A517T0A4_9BACT|nr:hypothetical protein SV7mr_43660 [Planctomycetes bacterium SV_7m_r]